MLNFRCGVLGTAWLNTTLGTLLACGGSSSIPQGMARPAALTASYRASTETATPPPPAIPPCSLIPRAPFTIADKAKMVPSYVNI